MKEFITIKKFGVIKEVSIPLNSINIFIGKQASGKSITAKLIYFFKRIFPSIFDSLAEGKSKREFDKEVLRKFESFFPVEYWQNEEFFIEYQLGNEKITLVKELHRRLKISYSAKILKLFTDCKRILKRHPVDEEEEMLFRSPFDAMERYYDHLVEIFGTPGIANQLFIPAGRSFFANLQSSIYTFLSKNKELDPFIVEFGTFYDRMKGVLERRGGRNGETKDDKAIDKLVKEILCGRYVREKEHDYIVHDDGRKVDLSFSSSGQQETLPLIVILKAITKIGFFGNGATVYIEEPEAHLFPSAQKRIVELIARVYNSSRSELQFIITTHSPYILTSFNNLLEANILSERNDVDKQKLTQIVPQNEMVKRQALNAYAFQNNRVINLMDKTTDLISAEILDQVSEEIALQFDELLSL